jgi:hypothetical protein
LGAVRLLSRPSRHQSQGNRTARTVKATNICRTGVNFSAPGGSARSSHLHKNRSLRSSRNICVHLHCMPRKQQHTLMSRANDHLETLFRSRRVLGFGTARASTFKTAVRGNRQHEDFTPSVSCGQFRYPMSRSVAL